MSVLCVISFFNIIMPHEFPSYEAAYFNNKRKENVSMTEQNCTGGFQIPVYIKITLRLPYPLN